MGHSVKAMTCSASLLWGACMLVVGAVNLVDASYGGDFLRMMNSIYPGADATRTAGSVLLGAVYGVLDGAVGGFLFGSLYSFFTRQQHKIAH